MAETASAGLRLATSPLPAHIRVVAVPASARHRDAADTSERPSWLDQFLTQGGPDHG